MARSCIFCQREATLTGEHIWSRWTDQGTIKGYLFKRWDPDGVNVQEHKTKSLDLKANVVCQTCNNGWMSDLEVSAQRPLKPMMKVVETGDSVSLSPTDAITLGAYAFMKAIVADHMQSAKKPFFTPQIRHRFSRQLKIPDGVQMWTAGFSSRIHRSRGFNRRRYYEFKIPPVKQLRLYVHTYSVGPVILQVGSFRWPRQSKRPLPFPVLTQNQAWNVCAHKFWPSNNAAVFAWPLNAYLSDDSIDGFSNRWGNLVTPNAVM